MVSRRSIIWMMTGCLLLASCEGAASSHPTRLDRTQIASAPVPLPTLPPETSTAAPDYVAGLRNAEYQLGAVGSLRVVKLTEGKFEQGTPGAVDFISVLVTDFAARGDLNRDGVDEFAVLAAENYGGTRVFVFLAVYVEIGGRFVFQTSTLVDDRPLLNRLSIEDGEIILDATIHGFEDPACCPSLRTRRHYRLAEGQLDMTDYATFTPDDRARTINIESPANGEEVSTSVEIKGSVAIVPFENALEYHIYDPGGVELSVGAIPVSAEGTGSAGTFDTVIRLGNILSSAVIRIEVQDISAADRSLLAMDSVELVVK